MTLKNCSAFIAIFLLCTQGFSNIWENRYGVGASSSMFKMWGGAKDRTSLSYNMSIEGRYGVLPFLQLGADLGYGSFKPSRRGTSTIADQSAPFRTFVLPMNVTLKATPLAKNSVKPYGLVGAGLLFWSLRNVGANDGTILTKGRLAWGEKMLSDVNFGLVYGIGFEWFLKERFALDFQARNTRYFGATKDNVGYGDANDKLGEFKVSALYYLGGNYDRDKDGIPDKIDLAPLEPEDFDGFQDADGAPDPDNDNDGILDVNDAAPNEPEDMDGFQDADGAPDPDNDNDGVLDVNDGAPTVPEDIDGFQDDDGVPDVDNDKDGILDAVDKCPNQAETVNGFQDDDGCPDVQPLPEVLQKDAFLLVKVAFETGKSDLTVDSYDSLDQLVQGLKDFPKVVIEIRGHTDNVGNAMLNQLLSEKRADSVRKYIIDKGIDPTRVTAVGFGERFPIADNSTPEGRAKNRRIEMIRIK